MDVLQVIMRHDKLQQGTSKLCKKGQVLIKIMEHAPSLQTFPVVAAFVFTEVLSFEFATQVPC